MYQGLAIKRQNWGGGEQKEIESLYTQATQVYYKAINQKYV
jgi:hypothetical protein